MIPVWERPLLLLALLLSFCLPALLTAQDKPASPAAAAAAAKGRGDPLDITEKEYLKRRTLAFELETILLRIEELKRRQKELVQQLEEHDRAILKARGVEGVVDWQSLKVVARKEGVKQ